MQDNLRESYDLVPYRHGAIPVSHPARIGAIGRIHALNCAPPDHCRVLELGCAEGMDLSPVQIATGESARVACSLGNARLVCADLREFQPEPESYDYIIAHGVYSWVSDEVKE